MLPPHQEVPGAPWQVLPPGIHDTTFDELFQIYGFNPKRRELLKGLKRAARALCRAGCATIYIDGSFVSDKERPADFDVCWDPHGVDPALLDPIFLIFSNKRAAQKARYGGEFLPSNFSTPSGQTFLDFFQTEKHTGAPKGIARINLLLENLEL